MSATQKILIIGTSHTGAFYTARQRIKTGFPTLEVSYFGLPGRIYSSASYKDGIFRAPEDASHQLGWMTHNEIDFAPFARILHVGERYTLNHAMRLMVFHDILEEPERTKRAFLSQAALNDLLRGLVRQRAEGLVARFGPEPRHCFLPAPYPLARSVAPGPGHEFALASLRKRSHGADWMRRYEAMIGEEMALVGLDVMLQPQETRAGQFMTEDRYARPKTETEMEPGSESVDHRHMNADYGWQVFCAFAQSRLGLTPEDTHALAE
jgi:hypothetical protein